MTPKQEEALREWLQEAIVPLIEQVLVKKLGQAMSFAASELVQPQRTWVGLTRMDLIKCGVLPFGMSYELCQAIEAKLKEKNT